MFMWTGYFELETGTSNDKKPRYSRIIPLLNDKFKIVPSLAKEKHGAISFEFRNKPGWHLRAGEKACFIEPKRRGNSYDKDCSFFPLVDLWFPGYVAFESVSMAAYYLRMKDGKLILDHYDGTDDFKEEASFKMNKIQTEESDKPDSPYQADNEDHAETSKAYDPTFSDTDSYTEDGESNSCCRCCECGTQLSFHLDERGGQPCECSDCEENSYFAIQNK